MSAVTIHLPDTMQAEVERIARGVNLSLPDFMRLALEQNLARSIKDPRLEERAARATGQGWDELKKYIPDAPPLPGDELSDANE